MEYSTLKVETNDRVTVITLNRPEKKNAMNPRLHGEMNDLLDHVADDDATHVVILTGAGDSFCAGQDLKEFFADTYDEPSKARRVTQIAMAWGEKLRLCPKPTICAVNGFCFGGGLRVMGLCDFAIASDRAVFGLSEVNFGILPAGGSTKVPVELLSHRDALYLILTGEPIDAQKADHMRLINKAVPHERLWEEVNALADKLKKIDPVALMLAKEVFWRSKFMDYPESVDWELAKHSELSLFGRGRWVEKGIKRFLSGQYKPGLQSYLETEEKK